MEDPQENLRARSHGGSALDTDEMDFDDGGGDDYMAAHAQPEAFGGVVRQLSRYSQAPEPEPRAGCCGCLGGSGRNGSRSTRSRSNQGPDAQTVNAIEEQYGRELTGNQFSYHGTTPGEDGPVGYSFAGADGGGRRGSQESSTQ